MSKRVILPIAVALLGAVVLVQATSEAHPTSDAAPAPVASELSPEGIAPLNHWFALGSGCRAKDDVPGDVTMEVLPPDAARPNIVRARFHLNQFKLDSHTLSGDKIPTKFARECSVRLNVNPPAGKRVTNVTALTKSMVETKVPGTKLTTISELKIGQVTLGRTEKVFSAEETVENRPESVELTPGTKVEENFPDLACAEPKIIAFNYTWLAERGTSDEDVVVHLDGDKTLDIEAELSACP